MGKFSRYCDETFSSPVPNRETVDELYPLEIQSYYDRSARQFRREKNNIYLTTDIRYPVRESASVWSSRVRRTPYVILFVKIYFYFLSLADRLNPIR
jgi:hypothetical protein